MNLLNLNSFAFSNLKKKGIWPESESFNDEGFGPPPKTWKGTCQTENNFTCNNKIIGARYYNSPNLYFPEDFKSPRDSEGHGTHTSSTAAGREVSDVSFYGLGQGLARGAVPNARIAMYKVCWSWGCTGADILAGFDDAIADGVSVLSVSLGALFAVPYLDDPVGIGAFHAMRNGILTANSAGNEGPYLGSVVNVAPWSLTVAASNIDRQFVSQVVLGNGAILMGNALNTFALNGSMFPLIYGGDAPNISASVTSDLSQYCVGGWLNENKVQGKIVLCDVLWDGSGALLADGVGTIMSDPRFSDLSFAYPLAATHIGVDDGKTALDYIRSTDNPVATILVAEAWSNSVAPRVVSFSARGPNIITPDILKPDLTAPGADILAAWSPVAIPSVSYLDKRRVKYNIISGTSMSCPHVSGAAAYIKSLHPDWSPAAIKSALMTTAFLLNTEKNDEAEFAYGSGHIDPLQAADPGLVFDLSEDDYVEFLCKQGYNTTTLLLITGDSSNCSSNATGNSWDLNYPSLALTIQDGQPIMGTFPRTVTNVGSPNSTYTATVSAPSILNVTVEPSVLSFSSIGQKQSFTVTVSGGVITQQPIISASVVWSDGLHKVRTPLVVYTVVSTAIESPEMTTPDSLEGSSLYNKNGILKGVLPSKP
ncbi:subtilisin-like protease SBT4.3 [Tasmannia lanceolata]|uniref:subtilisin-like protease SBT4.3 n=1 Tax=Tasmannia lanceolata TaxID=3420 RepID=UPI0040648FA4